MKVPTRFSTGWANYRHQSDVLAHYQMLRQAGVPDERIILILEGDVAKQGDSPFNGAVMNQVPGEDLFRDVVIDYTGVPPLKNSNHPEQTCIMTEYALQKVGSK